MKDDEQNKMLSMLISLEKSDDFKVWRDEVAKPLLEQLELDLSTNADNMPEGVLRGKLKHYFSEKYRFYDVFDQVKAQKKILLEEKNANKE